MSGINWDSYTLAELLNAVDHGQDVPASALALAARLALDAAEDAWAIVRALGGEITEYRAQISARDEKIQILRQALS